MATKKLSNAEFLAVMKAEIKRTKQVEDNAIKNECSWNKTIKRGHWMPSIKWSDLERLWKMAGGK